MPRNIGILSVSCTYMSSTIQYILTIERRGHKLRRWTHEDLGQVIQNEASQSHPQQIGFAWKCCVLVQHGPWQQLHPSSGTVGEPLSKSLLITIQSAYRGDEAPTKTLALVERISPVTRCTFRKSLVIELGYFCLRIFAMYICARSVSTLSLILGRCNESQQENGEGWSILTLSSQAAPALLPLC